MADIIIQGTTCSGSPTNTAAPQRPKTITRKLKKIGRLIEAADGSTSWVHRGFKYEWTIDWGDKANQTTQTAVIGWVGLTATFAFRDIDSVLYTVVNVGDDTYEELISSDRSNAYKYDLKLILREA